eukprot:jgi/Chlat1/3553/Chrsp234S03553
MARHLAAAAKGVLALGAAGRRQVHSASSHMKLDLYQVLGLKPGCPQEHVKPAFYQMAKRLHPDSAGGSGESAAAFVALVAAYEVLGDPHRRKRYDANYKPAMHNDTPHFHQRTAGTTAAGSTASHSADASDIPRYESSAGSDFSSELDAATASWLSRYSTVAAWVYRHSGVEIKMTKEFYHALRLAYAGPELQVRESFPQYFEADERTTQDCDHVLQMVRGRDLLGYVRLEPDVDCLSANLKTLPASRWHDCNARMDAYEEDCEPSSSRRESHKHASSSHGDEDWHESCEANFCTLQLVCDDEVIAVSRRKRRRHARNGWEDCISVLARDVDTDGDAFTEVATVVGPYLNRQSGALSQRSVFTANGRMTHSLHEFTTPFVRHMHWMRMLSNGKAACECSSQRAKLPPARLWLFAPREASHNGGGWYFERYSSQDYVRHRTPFAKAIPIDYTKPFRADAGSLHPAAYVLAAAYSTLDAEAACQPSGLRSALEWAQKAFWHRQ